ncbi:MAG: DNA mismatch repair endonuclease MutL [Bacteroidetes bacterium]|nr:DNA mismatch repair endonuclease MutL [Bacteroidota bacterium]
MQELDGIIRLLPEHVANQIAAGEVVQRPASVVKELLENAIDAGATEIKLIVKDAGKTLIQVIDNGKGMNVIDARMAFERHATSKITKAEDLFNLHTKGFRGEALASIAAVAQVELNTKQHTENVGRKIIIEGGKFIAQEDCSTSAGSNILIKNLFFNIPARRNFLKSDQIELKHIYDEIERVALPHSNISFIFVSNGNEVYNLQPGTLIHRVKSLFGNYLQKELVPVNEDTGFLKITGYVSLPQFATKTRKEQYFFVNNRYIKSPFLNHAINEAYKELISYQSNPKYVIFLDLSPKDIDINVHPTKTEVKFTDERTIYKLLNSSIKRALGKVNAGASLDFEQEQIFNSNPLPKGLIPQQPKVSYNSDYNPFKSNQSQTQVANKQHWEKLFEGFKTDNKPQTVETTSELNNEPANEKLLNVPTEFLAFQIQQKYIISYIENALVIVDQQRAHEQVLYEYFYYSENKQINSQQLLFAEQMELSTNDYSLVKTLFEEFKNLGYIIESFGKNSIIINGVPSDLQDSNIVESVENILENYKLNTIDSKLNKHDNLCRAIAKSNCVKYGKILSNTEINQLLNSLYLCKSFMFTAASKPIIQHLSINEIEKFFKAR